MVKNSSVPDRPMAAISSITYPLLSSEPPKSCTGTKNGYAAASTSVMPANSQPAVLKKPRAADTMALTAVWSRLAKGSYSAAFAAAASPDSTILK